MERSSLFRCFCFFVFCFKSSFLFAGDVVHIPGKPAQGQPFPAWEAVTFNFDPDNPAYKAYVRSNEYYESVNSLLWIPVIRHAVEDAIKHHVIHEKHAILFENVMFGLISVETTGRFAQTGNFGQSEYQKLLGSFRGLTQMVAEKHYMEENPYDPVTALKIGLRTLAPFVYKTGSMDAALAEHNNGKKGIEASRLGVDAFCTVGQEFAMRVYNAAWWGHHLLETKREELDLKKMVSRQFEKGSPYQQYYRYAPPWRFLDIEDDKILVSGPELPFNWNPPESSFSWSYINSQKGNNWREKRLALIDRKIAFNSWSKPAEFKFPVTNNTSEDKSHCASALEHRRIVLGAMATPEFIIAKSFSGLVSSLELHPLTPRESDYFPQGIFGKTPAYQDNNHQFYLEGSDILKDIPGIDRTGKRYFHTRSSVLSKEEITMRASY